MTQTPDNAANTDDRVVATALTGVLVRGEQNLLAESAAPGIAGARAALETFYYAFNTRSLALYQRIWADDPLAQLNTPIAGLVRGTASISALSQRMLSSPVRIQSVFEDIVAYATPELVVFTGRERGEYARNDEPGTAHERPDVRTSCICVFRFIAEQGGWRQVYHHVSLDDAAQLAQFQRAARGG
jgi:hypothetical protein